MDAMLDYHKMLKEINNDIGYLMKEDVADEVSSHLERVGFRRVGESSSELGFIEKGFKITYIPDREEPFRVDLQKKEGRTILEVNKVLGNILLKVLEEV